MSLITIHHGTFSLSFSVVRLVREGHIVMTWWVIMYTWDFFRFSYFHFGVLWAITHGCESICYHWFTIHFIMTAIAMAMAIKIMLTNFQSGAIKVAVSSRWWETLSLLRNFIQNWIKRTHTHTLTIGKRFGALLLQITALKVDRFLTHDSNKKEKLTIQFEIKRVFSRPEVY